MSDFMDQFINSIKIDILYTWENKLEYPVHLQNVIVRYVVGKTQFA